jgi:hypothetical protein
MIEARLESVTKEREYTGLPPGVEVRNQVGELARGVTGHDPANCLNPDGSVLVAECKRRLRLYDQLSREDRAMDAKKQKRLEAAGWTVGDAAAFLKLTPEGSALVEMRLALGRTLRERRQAAGLTQTALAKQPRSSQLRVTKLEGDDASVSLELLIRALLSVGASRNDVAHALARRVA